MKMSEFKLKLISGLNGLIDDYFGSYSMADKLINATLKIMVKQNQNKYDGILELFADENGEMDEQLIVEEYSKILGNDGFILDLRDYIKNDMIKNLLPNKALKVTKHDLINMFR